MSKLRPPATAELTPRQLQVAKAIARLTKANRRPPTYRDLMAALKIDSPNGIRCHILALTKKGIAEKQNHKHGIILIGVCPCCGRSEP